MTFLEQHTPLTSQESTSLPVYLTVLAGILVTYFSHISAEMVLQNPPIYALSMGSELVELMNEMRVLSEGIQNLVKNVDFPSLTESIDRYRNLVDLHIEVERVFDHWQRILSDLERAAAMRNQGNINNLYNVYDQLSERLREENNVLVEALRSLEDNIRDKNPAFEFLTRQWFE